MQSGIGLTTAPDPDQVLHQALAMSAVEAVKNAVLEDTKMLVYHQIIAQEHHLLASNLVEDGEAKDSTAEADIDAEDRKILFRVAFLYHVLANEGFYSQIRCLMDHFYNGTDLTDADRSNPCVQTVLAGVEKYRSDIFQGNMMRIIEMASSIDPDFINVTDETESAAIISSYELYDEIPVTVWEDDTVQCGCHICEKFFEFYAGEPHLNTEFDVFQMILMRAFQNSTESME